MLLRFFVVSKDQCWSDDDKKLVHSMTLRAPPDDYHFSMFVDAKNWPMIPVGKEITLSLHEDFMQALVDESDSE